MSLCLCVSALFFRALIGRLAGMRVTVVTPYRNYLIFFCPSDDAVEVFRIVHGARELARVVEEIQLDFEDDER